MMKIRVYNIADGEVFSYHLPIFIGEIYQSMSDGSIYAKNLSDPEGLLIEWPVIEGCFKLLVYLKLGNNDINLQYMDESLTISVVYENPNFLNFVRPVYIVCADDDGYFQGPDSSDCSPSSAQRRIIFGAELIQTFTAEKMKEHGFGRTTFQLERDDNNNHICHLVHSKLTLEQAYSMTGIELWNYFAKELMSSDFDKKDRCKWYCFMSFTRYHLPDDQKVPKTHGDILKYTKGHTALGGGGLALFGTGNLHTWAENLEQLHYSFTDDRKIDRRKYMDDSAYREYYWANYATGLGATLHELGHAFDLAHTKSGIMARGFDDIHKVFIIQRLKSGRLSQQSMHYSNTSLSRTASTSSMDSYTSYGNSLDRKHKETNCYKKKLQTNEGNIFAEPQQLFFSVETSFKPVKSPSAITLSVKNYDGTETKKKFSQEACRNNSFHSYAALTEDEIRHNIRRGGRRSSSASSISSISNLSSSPSTLPNSPDEDCIQLPEMIFSDGAHWFRSSAVILKFHSWFNKSHKSNPQGRPALSGCCIKSPFGLRVIEVRSDPEGLVLQFWEFLNENPPTEFSLRKSQITTIPEDARTFSILAQDSYGNILKKRLKVSHLK